MATGEEARWRAQGAMSANTRSERGVLTLGLFESDTMCDGTSLSAIARGRDVARGGARVQENAQGESYPTYSISSGRGVPPRQAAKNQKIYTQSALFRHSVVQNLENLHIVCIFLTRSAGALPEYSEARSGVRSLRLSTFKGDVFGYLLV